MKTTQTIKTKLINTILAHQKANNLTDSGLAEACGCNPTIIHYIGKGAKDCKVTIDKLLSLTDTLGYKIELNVIGSIKVKVSLESANKKDLVVELSELGYTTEQWQKLSRKDKQAALNGLIQSQPAPEWEVSIS